MAVKINKYWTPPRKSGGIPRVSTRFSLSVENEHTRAGRDGPTYLVRPNSQARTGTGKNSVFHLAEHEQDRQPYVVDAYSAVNDDHVCVFSSHPFWTSSSLDVPAGVTQEEGHTGFLIHLPSAVRALIFLARRIQPFLSLVDREVEFCVLTN